MWALSVDSVGAYTSFMFMIDSADSGGWMWFVLCCQFSLLLGKLLGALIYKHTHTHIHTIPVLCSCR